MTRSCQVVGLIGLYRIEAMEAAPASVDAKHAVTLLQQQFGRVAAVLLSHAGMQRLLLSTPGSCESTGLTLRTVPRTESLSGTPTRGYTNSVSGWTDASTAQAVVFHSVTFGVQQARTRSTPQTLQVAMQPIHSRYALLHPPCSYLGSNQRDPTIIPANWLSAGA